MDLVLGKGFVGSHNSKLATRMFCAFTRMTAVGGYSFSLVDVLRKANFSGVLLTFFRVV
jgi:hypothetical protein